MARNVYYPYDFEAHRNLSHKQFQIKVYYFMDYAVGSRVLLEHDESSLMSH